MAKLSSKEILEAGTLLEGFLQDNLIELHNKVHSDGPLEPSSDSELVKEYWELGTEILKVLETHLRKWGK